MFVFHRPVGYFLCGGNHQIIHPLYDSMDKQMRKPLLTVWALFMMNGLLATALSQENVFKPTAEYYRTGNWPADTLGNHRVVVRVADPAPAVYVMIPWRRCDADPANKGVLIAYGQTNALIHNVFIKEINQEYGEIVFEPTMGAGIYYIYYLPYQREGMLYWGQVKYLAASSHSDKNWLEAAGIPITTLPGGKPADLPHAEVVEFQSRTLHDSFYPMEIIATAAEVDEMIDKHGQDGYLLFPEDRKYPIRMNHFLPYRWVGRAGNSEFQAEARKNEYYSFQIGLFAFREKLENVKIIFSDLKGTKNAVIPHTRFESIHLNGRDWLGREIVKKISVERGQVKPVWISIDVPETATPDTYTGMISICPENQREKRIRLTMVINDSIAVDRGDGEPWRHSRLRWLNSQIALDDEIVKPFIPLEKQGNTIHCLGRSVTVQRNGYLSSVKSYFSPSVTRLNGSAREILYKPVSFEVYRDHRPVEWRLKKPVFTKQTAAAIEWEFVNQAAPLRLEGKARMEFDGRIEYQVELSSDETMLLDDVVLTIPMDATVAKYAMGMQLKGGLRPDQHSWKWNADRNQDNIWIGDVNAGLQLQLKGDNYERPLVNIHYHHRKIKLPDGWYNQGNGGCTFQENGRSLALTAYGGRRLLQAGQKVTFIFSFLITPFKPINTDAQWSERYYHAHPAHPLPDVDSMVASGANIINIHQAIDSNPFINYPFCRVAELKNLVDQAHAKNALLKIYYTVREMSNHICEMSALRSLDDEIFADGPGRGDAWLQEHLQDHYIPAWYDLSVRDAAIITSGMSRLHNYYLEGLDWLAKNVAIDGLYLDDVAYDRTVMKRARKILDRNRPNARIDLHSWNHFNEVAGFANNANLYMENFPYIDRLWFGEVFDYETTSPDYWLVEISGIPFGLMGEMLGDNRGGNVYRGMVYGMTNRLPWSGDPRNLWKLWDAFGMQGSEMIGYWDAQAPVKTNRSDVLATAYVKKKKALIALASWNQTAQQVKLTIDWKKLGMDAQKAAITAPAVENFQAGARYSATDAIPIDPAKGMLLIIEEQ